MKQQIQIRQLKRFQLYGVLLFILLIFGLTMVIMLKHVMQVNRGIMTTLMMIVVILGYVSLFICIWINHKIKKQMNHWTNQRRFNKVSGQLESLNQQTLNQLKMAEEQLKEAYLEINGILESINDGFLATDLEWRITYINTEAKLLIRQPPNANLLGEVIWDVIPELIETPVYKNLHRAFEERIPAHYEIYNKIDRKWFDIYAYPRLKGVSLLIREITEHKNAEIALEQSRQQIYDIIESISDGFFALDQDCRYLYMNRSHEFFMKGYTRDEATGKKIDELFPDFQGTLLHQYILRTVNEKIPLTFEEYFVPVDAWLESRVYPAKDGGVLVFCSDITQRKKAEQALEAERELLATVLSSVEEGVIATDIDGRIILMSRSAEELTGWNLSEAKGEALERCFYVISDQTSEPYTNLVADMLDSQSPISLSNSILITKALHEVKIGLYCAPLEHAANKQPLGAVIVFEDVTEKQRMEQELLKTEKLESLGILAGGIAHDFNNYLAAILSNIQLAKIMLAKGKNVDKNLDQAIDVSVKAGGLTRQLLTFAKGGTPVKKLGSIRQLIEDTVQFNLRGSKVKSVFLLPETLWNAEFDHSQISQVLSNLVVNAKQAMPKGGILEVSAQNVILHDVQSYRPGKYLMITVKDQGTGIPETIIDKIFDPFFTTKPDGNGLGLATSYSIISKHGGYIEISSVPNQGCTCTFYLPASEDVLPGSVLADAQLPGVFRGSILLMDDEAMIRNIMEESLTFMGFKVVTTKDGEETIDCYQRMFMLGTPFDVIILDLTIPGGMDGLETLAQLRKINPDIKAVVSSGYANDPVIAEYQNYGFAAFASKPYKLNELTEILYRLIGDVA